MAKKTTTIEQNQSVLERVKGMIAQVARAAAKDVAALEENKADKLSGVTVTVSAAGWSSDSTAGYPKYYDIAISGVTVKDRATVDLAPEAQCIAVECGLCPACETLAGKIRLRAVSVPTETMAATYWIQKGA